MGRTRILLGLPVLALDLNASILPLHSAPCLVLSNFYLYYSADELSSVLEKICAANDYELSDSARAKADQYFQSVVLSRKDGDNFANGRMARNIYDDLVMNHARRIIDMKDPTPKDLSTIIDEDFKI